MKEMGKILPSLLLSLAVVLPLAPSTDSANIVTSAIVTPTAVSTVAVSHVPPRRLPIPAGKSPSPVLTLRTADTLTETAGEAGGVEVVRTIAATTSWNTVPNLPTPRAGAQVVTDAHGNIFVFGGRDQNYQVTGVVEAYFPSKGLWYCSKGDSAPGCSGQIFPPLPTPRTNMAIAPVWSNGLFFLIGGQDVNNRIVGTVEVYSVAENIWYCSFGDQSCNESSQVVYPLPTPRAFAAGATGPDGRVYVVGGIDGSGSITQTVEAWDPYTQRWFCSKGDSACGSAFQILAPLPTPRVALSAVRGSTDLIYVMGGLADTQTLSPLAMVEAYDVYTNRWYCSTSVTGCATGFQPKALPTARSDLAAAVGPDGKIYVAGGAQALSTTAVVDSYDPANNIWKAGEALPSARAASAAITSADRLYVLGGMLSADPASVTNRVDAYKPPPPARPSPFIARQKSYPSSFLPFSQALLTAAARYHGQPTNTVFGNYTYQQTDLAMPGFGPEVRITRSYNSAYPGRGIFGWGWNTNFGMHLIIGTSTVEVERHDGRIDAYTWQNGSLVPPAGSVDQLARNAQDGTYTLSTRQRLIYDFDAQGRLLSVKDSEMNTVKLQYNTSGQWIGIQDAGGRLWKLTYNAQGLVSGVTNPAGQTVAYTYSDSGDLVSVTDPAGGVLQYKYDASGYHQLLAIYDTNGHTVIENYYLVELDQVTGQWYGRVTRQVDSRGENRYFYYFDGISAYVDPTGAVSWTFYDSYHQPVLRIDPLGDVTWYQYSGGFVTGTMDANFGSSSFTYDGRGNLLSTTDPLGHTSQMAYDPRDNLIRETNPLGHATTWAYNSTDHPISMTNSLGQFTSYKYDAHGQQISTTDPLGNITGYANDAYGNRTSITDTLGNVARFTYIETGMVKTKEDPLGRKTTTTYDALNRPVAVTAPDGGITLYTYDKVGNLLTVTDPLGHVTAYTYTTSNDLATVKDALGNTTSYEYDAMGRQTRRIMADGSQWTAAYDSAGRKIWETSPLCNQNPDCARDPLAYCDAHRADCHSTLFTYDAKSNLLSRTNPAGYQTRYAYDLNNRLVKVTDALGGVTIYSYDAAGNRTSVTDARGNRTTYEYDLLNRKVRETNMLNNPAWVV